ncbi:Glycosyltransferase, GT2 family [Pseudoxanthobacter soli DSM 19599]|uniref:Glycosyltransferase, GT2 family n=1 Tax=Pseudoxanthobacter soli DSM 19599 TaxID=1123029 RepID=A0A1M7ZF73_9HYPH|nr:glycosyltransferase [Pseudoxanthobacter soli]SHO63459.1 Glycosyltransferase, GT2 family [Pseudoxanthobacter soli DSM 19599]
MSSSDQHLVTNDELVVLLDVLSSCAGSLPSGYVGDAWDAHVPFVLWLSSHLAPRGIVSFLPEPTTVVAMLADRTPAATLYCPPEAGRIAPASRGARAHWLADRLGDRLHLIETPDDVSATAGTVDLVLVDGAGNGLSAEEQIAALGDALSPHAVALVAHIAPAPSSSAGSPGTAAWRALLAAYPAAFPVGRGLAVVPVGTVPPGLQALAEAARGEGLQGLERLFARLGSLYETAFGVAAERSMAAERRASEAAIASRQIQRQLALAQSRADEALRAAAEAHAVLDATRASVSWRITRPVRTASTSFPAIARILRGFARNNPGLVHETRWALRAAANLARLKAPPPRVALPAPATAATSPAGREPVLWFFMGDTIDWLSDHSHLTGVGRVTAELFRGGVEDRPRPRWLPAIATAGGAGLAQVSAGNWRGSGPAIEELRKVCDGIPVQGMSAAPGDHVLFTGVIWNAHYVELIERLVRNGLTFSVLVHDIIPIDEPEFVSPEFNAGFTLWMDAVARKASTLFVSTDFVRHQIEAWAREMKIARRQPIVTIPFGPSLVPVPEAAKPLRPGVTVPYALSVGTIDKRKNQAMLPRLWRRLVETLGADKVPMLVLVGRDDLRLGTTDENVAALAKAGRIAILEDVADAELADLYRLCLFTVFPTLSEGYGLSISDTLAYGKVPISSGLEPIREYAGNLPWYFDPLDDDDAYRVMSRAVLNPDVLAKAEARIAAEWHPSSWRTAADVTAAALDSFVNARANGARIPDELRLDRPLEELRAKARRWSGGDRPDVSILIINWNAADMTRTCVEHIWEHTEGLTYEILIADNGSRRAEFEPLRVLEPDVRLVQLEVNRYFGEANNIIAEHARGRFLCLLNNDVFVPEGWLTGLHAALTERPKAAAVGPVFLFPDDTIQEAGGNMDPSGIPARSLRGKPAAAIRNMPAKAVDYISAAALLVHRDSFFDAGGFDLAFEPAYYEDTDFCFKLAALGQEVWLIPSVTVIHLEGYSTDEKAIPSARKRALGDLNRGKFLSRWGDYLEDRSPETLAAGRALFTPATRQRPAPPADARRALIYTPYNLTPGGGERYLLTLADALSTRFNVTIATPHPYSHLRLTNLACVFGLDLSGCRIVTELDLPDEPEFDIQVVMGNHVTPPIPAQARDSYYHCQFPFPLPADGTPDPALLTGYRAVLVNSDFTRRNVLQGMQRYNLPMVRTDILYPPVPPYEGDARAKKKRMILTVGRFFVGGHAKRHDLLIEAFRSLAQRVGGDVEFHLAGSSTPGPEHMDYLNGLQAMAADLPVVFHVNCSNSELAGLYRDAAIYWHGTGLEENLKQHPELAEHFGIAIAEAMSAGCVAFALNAGGAREIITDGEDGFLYDSLEMLTMRTAAILRPQKDEERIEIGTRAAERARAFTPDRFIGHVLELIS